MEIFADYVLSNLMKCLDSSQLETYVERLMFIDMNIGCKSQRFKINTIRWLLVFAVASNKALINAMKLLSRLNE